MQKDLAAIILRLISSGGDEKSPVCVEVGEQFDPLANDKVSMARSLTAGFLISLAGDGHPLAGRARQYLDSMPDRDGLGDLAAFLVKGLGLIEQEVEQAAEHNPNLARRLATARKTLEQTSITDSEVLRHVWGALFPEGLGGLGNRRSAVEALRRKRRVMINLLNPNPITDPAREILFTANALLTLPHTGTDLKTMDIGQDFMKRLKSAAESDQLYWYDHPIPMGIDVDRNEVIYGLKGLASTLAFEATRSPIYKGSRLSCLLSVSVTHQGLQELAREYLTKVVNQAGGVEGLDIYIFTEAETIRLKDEILFPSVKRYYPALKTEALDDILGVDGEYGRHYSFLKAVAAWWNVLVNPSTRATFKIDLDQVFPQAELVDQTGASAFEHLTSPLWGAKGRDSWGEEVELGLLAGALVNQSDLGQGIFTPDVPWPQKAPTADELVFFSPLPQALSTQAEMMTRYGGHELDGRTACLQRVHVTGGTTGALVESLRRHRPFTPTFIGRAEDQAYLLSILFDQNPRLRYLHKDGLIMRHDKAALIPEAIEMASTSKIIGDYIRILWFSHYARALPWPLEDIKAVIDPFTGCFVSDLPLCLVHLRLTLKAAGLFAQNRPETDAQAIELLELSTHRLGEAINYLGEGNDMAKRYAREKAGWNLYYNTLDSLENDLRSHDPFALEIKRRALKLLDDCRIRMK